MVSILKGSSLINSDATHPAAADTAKFCVSRLEGGGSVGGANTALHILALLKELLSTFPKAFIKVRLSSFQLFFVLEEKQPSELKRESKGF